MQIGRQLFLAIVFTGLFAAVTVILLFFITTREGFTRYVVEAEMDRMSRIPGILAEIYDTETPGWPELTQTPQSWHSFIGKWSRPDRLEGTVAREDTSDVEHIPPPKDLVEGLGLGAGSESAAEDRPEDELIRQIGRLPPDLFHTVTRTFLTDANEEVIVGRRPESHFYSTRAIVKNIDGQRRVVGYFGISAPVRPGWIGDTIYFNTIVQTTMMAFSMAVLMSVLVAVFLTQHILKPIENVTDGALALAEGDFSVRLPTKRRDELRTLVRDFNSLAEQLERAQKAERQFLSDTSHELQTPIAVIRAEIEAIQDGVRKPDDRTLSEMHASIMRLSALVRDLQVLAFSREGQFRVSMDAMDLRDVLDEVLSEAELEAAQKKLKITADLPDDLDTILTGDHLRLTQTFQNILRNAIKYTDGPGKIHLALDADDDNLIVSIADSAPTISTQDIPKLFVRFHRDEKSRSRSFGGSGLGLTIAKAIVEAHKGTIMATQSDLGGLEFRVTLPKNLNS